MSASSLNRCCVTRSIVEQKNVKIAVYKELIFDAPLRTSSSIRHRHSARKLSPHGGIYGSLRLSAERHSAKVGVWLAES